MGHLVCVNPVYLVVRLVARWVCNPGVLGQNGRGQNDTDKMARTKWYR